MPALQAQSSEFQPQSPLKKKSLGNLLFTVMAKLTWLRIPDNLSPETHQHCCTKLLSMMICFLMSVCSYPTHGFSY
jgi:hypothetical protein